MISFYFKGSKPSKIVVGVWGVVVFILYYYTILAIPLFLLGFNSFDLIDTILFGEETNSEGFKDLLYYRDIRSLRLPGLSFLGGLTTVLLVYTLDNFKKEKSGKILNLNDTSILDQGI
ncbi:MAG: hypothetical protein KTR26_18125 [Flammeovirgaceae bacterium]|nr:hypothetical protein [Flammeovirgaceae bacterium]